MTRTRASSVVFRHPFELKGVDRLLPAGTYAVETDEELVDGVSFAVWRRVSTMIFVPGASASSSETMTIDPADLDAAQLRDQDPGRDIPAR
jgi:hypothetical protein